MREILLRKKSIVAPDEAKSGLKRVLGPWSLIAIGIGCTIGAGIFVMPGEVAATKAGPAIILSFVLAAIASALAALSYCELASMIPVSGSAYSYTYATLGEFTAWFVGWNLLLEYGLANAAVAAGWGGYLNTVLRSFGLSIPPPLLYAPGETFQVIDGAVRTLSAADIASMSAAALALHPVQHGLLNLPAAVVIALVTILLVVGIRESARANTLLVAAKIVVLGLFIVLCAPHFKPELMQPFMPFGWQGVVSGAAVLFFLFIGFDAVSTVAEETKDPQRNLPIGIMGALAIVTVLYIGVAGLLCGLLPLPQLKVAEPLAMVLTALHHPVAAWILSVVAVVGIASVLLVGSIGQTRVLYVMSRDGLMPRFMSRIHARFGTPVKTTILLGMVTAVLAALIPLSALADLVSIGTLTAFCVVALGVMVLRRTMPDLPRTFRTPWVPVLPVLGIGINLYLMSGLSVEVWIRFLVWSAAGIALYFLWGHRSVTRMLAEQAAATPAPEPVGLPGA